MKANYTPRGGKRGSAAQKHSRGSFGAASCGWGSLTEDQYRAWDALAKSENRRRHLRKGHRLNGHNLFTEINSNQIFLSLPPYLYPPERPAFTLTGLGPLTADEGIWGVTLKLNVPEDWEGHILVFGARPCSPGRRYCDKLRYLGPLPAPSGGVSDITAPYCERHGVPRRGSRVIIAIQQQVNGWRDLPMRLDVIVPGGKGLAGPPRRRRTTKKA